MKDLLIEIRDRIRAGKFANEASISHGVVLPILNALSWPAFDPEVVFPEFPLEGTRIDYALCHPPTKPIVFIEVKQPGQNIGADRQLFGYVFHRGVPLAILTNGQEWHFFLPGEQGDYDERRVYKLDILERDPNESVARLKRYLDYQAVRSGEAIAAAREDYRDVAKDRQVRATLPEAWTKLVGDRDEMLLDLLAEKVESLCGYKPDREIVVTFFNERVHLMPPAPPSVSSSTKRAAPPQPTIVMDQVGHSAQGPYSFILDGRWYHVRHVKDVLIKVMEQLADRDATFLQRLDELPRHGRQRRYVARSREALYPGNPRLIRWAHELRPGWWLDGNVGKDQVEKAIQTACDVAGLKCGVDLRINWGEGI